MTLFKNLHLPNDLLEFPADQWKHQSNLNDAKKLHQFNDHYQYDHAERGIALIESFSGQFTKDEVQFQFASQVVADHCKKFTEFSKQTLFNNFESRR